MPQHIEAGADHLRLTSNGIRILHPPAFEVRRSNIAALHQFSQHAGDRNLPAVSAHALDALVERRVAALDRIG